MVVSNQDQAANEEFRRKVEAKFIQKIVKAVTLVML